jgi:hypothetical protein
MGRAIFEEKMIAERCEASKECAYASPAPRCAHLNFEERALPFVALCLFYVTALTFGFSPTVTFLLNTT